MMLSAERRVYHTCNMILGLRALSVGTDAALTRTAHKNFTLAAFSYCLLVRMATVNEHSIGVFGVEKCFAYSESG